MITGMHRHHLTAAILATLLVLSPAAAAAKDMSGRLGLGGEVSSVSGLSMKYWLSNVGFQAVVGIGITKPEEDVRWDFGLTLRGLFNLSRTEHTHLFVGGGLQLQAVIGGGGDSQHVELLLGVEHFFSNYFAISGHLGVRIGLSGPTEVSLGQLPSWGATFHYYF